MAERKDDSDLDDIPVSEEELQEALSVLAGSDPENCSYPVGYVKRQAVFACNTCTPSPAEPAGICLACANKCHDGHDIFELHTKRNFRCDCGNRKFQGFQCQLIPVKDEENAKNHYNHNFNGCYCICDRPYPDTDEQGRETGGEMIQCVVCEDWFHSKHLGCSIVEPEDLQEMVCEGCMNKAPFLWTYAANFAVPPVINVSQSEEEVEVDVEGGGQKEEGSEPLQNENEEPTSSHEEKRTKRSPTCKRTHEEMTGSPRKSMIKTATCKLKELQAQGLRRLKQGAVFWPYGWRSELCTCTSCKRAYVAAEVQFLMDQSDTMLAYENRGLDQPFGQHLLMALTSSMDHVQQLEVIYGIKELTTSITAFLGQHAAEGRTVTVEAVREFFAELHARKRRRTSAGCE
ncbi:putative E3 ubiquitin-protein ligase UBR7 [Mastacembelus armatus]|uniref:Ubiquitin protein ligase E3 component n-recognin 7 n=1 Tax=Mastacembelus armatus TaxID=205130 RepID=A0A3Q3L434_9TELE|nr:putative E3 ubiquitin-protein ligase UBR7 [Mastacembelus armatus]XP_026164031.1 putative E3 ubiquitin-protein ligase UBR7 [Mastacembelus armatus]